MSSPLLTAVGCTIASWSSTVTPEITGWTEHIELTVLGTDSCESVRIRLDDGVQLVEGHGRVSAAHGNHALGSERLVHQPVGDDGVSVWDLLVPELRTGDTARIQLTVTSGFVEDYLWRPSPGVAYAELRKPRGVSLTSTGLHADRRYVFTDHPSSDTLATLKHVWLSTTPAPLPPPGTLSPDEAVAALDGVLLLPRTWFGDAPVVGAELLKLGAGDDRGWTRTLVASTQAGSAPLSADAAEALAPDLAALTTPQVRSDLTLSFTSTHPVDELRPDRRLALLEERVLTWEDSTHARAHFFPVSDDVVGRPRPSDRCHWRFASGAAWVIAPPGVATCTVAIRHWVNDVWGELPADAVVGRAVATWTDRDGATQEEPLALEGHAWRLDHLAGTPILTDVDRLWQELHARFVNASFPEPALPLNTFARGSAAWELLAALPGVLRAQVVIRDDLHTSATRPRPLYRAREAGVVTSVEAAMILTLYARQQRLSADWILVRPAALGPAVGPTPEGFNTALVRVTVDGETRLLDPACEACAPFTFRPELRGSDVIGQGITHLD